ncbi:MAG: acyltransferase family protein [Lachnospiraceae bacterium]|nr:acyltransferase family protein [Lachnospiraceae bacterium]
MDAKRNTGFDIAKGIAFIGVVWGHFLSPYGTVIIYTFNLPLFFVVSGFFLSTKKPVREYILSKVKQLFPPYFITGAIMIVMVYIQGLMAGMDPQEAMGPAMERTGALLYGTGLIPTHPMFDVPFVGPIWFLPALFFALLIVRVCIISPVGYLGIAVCVALGYYSSLYIWLPMEIQAGAVMSGYAAIGYIVRRITEAVKKDKTTVQNTMICLGVFIITLVVWLLYLRGEKESILFCINQYPRGLVDYFGSPFAIFTVILCSILIISHIPVVSTYLSFIGKNSLVMLCAHAVDTMMISWSFYFEAFDEITWRELLLLTAIKFAIYSVVVLIYNLLHQHLGKLPGDKSDQK